MWELGKVGFPTFPRRGKKCVASLYSPFGLVARTMYGTRQAARQWHQRICGWMESHDYMAVNNEKTMFMKWEGSDFIMHGLFVDDMAHVSTSQKMIKKFMKEYSRDFEYTGGDFMTSFLGLEVEQDQRTDPITS
jgi:hypothetical protein